jgi:hypothetical protein
MSLVNDQSAAALWLRTIKSNRSSSMRRFTSVLALGTLPVGTATALNGTFRRTAHTGFLEASNALPTQNPQTRELYLLNSQTAHVRFRVYVT